MDFHHLAEVAFVLGDFLFIPLAPYRNPNNFPVYLSPTHPKLKRMGFTTELPKNRLENLVWMAQQLDPSFSPPTGYNKQYVLQFIQGRVVFTGVHSSG